MSPDPSESTAPEPRRIWWVLTPDMERTLRFLVGTIILAQQTMFASEPNTLAVGAGMVLAGSPLANMADDARKALRRNGNGSQ